MVTDQPFRGALLVLTLVLFPAALYYRLRSQATRERLDRRQEGWFILLTLRPVGLLGLAGLVTFLVNPARMAWSSVPIPVACRWAGVVIAFLGGALLVWTFKTLGPNLTDTVVTRRVHTLVTSGPYRWVRHPFYGSVAFLLVGSALATANWFILATAVVAFALIVVRTKREEENLVARFGEAYSDYMARTGQFLPRLL